MRKTTIVAILGAGTALAAAILIKGRGKPTQWYRDIPLMAYRKARYTAIQSRTVRIMYAALFGLRDRVRKAVSDPFWADALIKHEIYAPDFRVDPETGALEMTHLGLSLAREQSHLLSQYDATMYRKKVVENLFDTQYARDEQGAILATAGGIRIRVDTVEGYGLLWEMFEDRTYDYDLGEPFVVWDIGMNAGVASLFFATIPNVRMIFGFEPFPRTYAAAEYNFSLNPDLAQKLHPHNSAIGDADGTAIAFDNQDLRGGNSLRWSNKRVESDSQVNLTVRNAVSVLDEIIAASGELPIVCKLDAEGAEYTILPALARAGRLGDIKAFMIEYHKEGSQSLVKVLVDSHFHVVARPHGRGSQFGYIYAAQPGIPFPAPERESVRRAAASGKGKSHNNIVSTE